MVTYRLLLTGGRLCSNSSADPHTARPQRAPTQLGLGTEPTATEPTGGATLPHVGASSNPAAQHLSGASAALVVLSLSLL